MYKKLSTFLLFLALAVTGLQAKDYNVKDFGAMGDGKTLDHHAINAAIDTCVAHGGGVSFCLQEPISVEASA